MNTVHDLLLKNKNKIKFHWIEAHVGEAGNEAANQAAKIATEKGVVDVNIGFRESPIKKLLQQRVKKMCNSIGTKARQEDSCMPF